MFSLQINEETRVVTLPHWLFARSAWTPRDLPAQNTVLPQHGRPCFQSMVADLHHGDWPDSGSVSSVLSSVPHAEKVC